MMKLLILVIVATFVAGDGDYPERIKNHVDECCEKSGVTHEMLEKVKKGENGLCENDDYMKWSDCMVEATKVLGSDGFDKEYYKKYRDVDKDKYEKCVNKAKSGDYSHQSCGFVQCCIGIHCFL